MAIEFSIRLQSQLPGGEHRGLKLLRDVIARAKVHLVRSLTVECRVGKLAVVLLDVKLNELPDAGCRVECVEEQPLVLEDTPPRLDQRVGIADLRLSKNSRQ